jgi:gamma-glutamyltranspeptidase/glutathione hydrolase
LTYEDLAQHQVEWVMPISCVVFGYTLHEFRPMARGLRFDDARHSEHTNIAEYEADSADSLHVQIEAMSLAFADVHRYVADPAWMRIDAIRS